jgi:hypothetical protein
VTQARGCITALTYSRRRWRGDWQHRAVGSWPPRLNDAGPEREAIFPSGRPSRS